MAFYSVEMSVQALDPEEIKIVHADLIDQLVTVGRIYPRLLHRFPVDKAKSLSVKGWIEVDSHRSLR